MYSKMNVGEKILVGVHFGLLWIRKFAKEMAKALARQSGIYWHSFMKIMENKRKGR